MAVDGVGLGPALLSELNKIIKSMQERNACYREGPMLFGQVDCTLTRLNLFAGTITEKLQSNPQALSQEVLPDFVATLETVKGSLLNAENAVTVYCSKTFFGNSSSNRFQELANKEKRFARAKSLSAIMSNIRRDTSEAENKLQHLLTHLGLALLFKCVFREQ